MTDLPGVYMRAPETWPFKTPTIPSKLVPSHKTYAPNNEGLVFVDPRDIATLLGLGFYLYGQTPNINALLAGLPGAGDSSMFLAMDGVGRTPAGGGGGSSGLVPISGFPRVVSSPVTYIDIPLSTDYLWFQLVINDVVLSTADSFGYALSRDGGTTFLNDSNNGDTYVSMGSLMTAFINGTGDRTLTPAFTWKSLGFFDGCAGSFYTPTGGDIEATINPGSSTSYGNVVSSASVFDEGTGRTLFFIGRSYLNQSATVTPTKARANLMRVVPWGNGDVNLPTGGGTIVSCIIDVLGAPVA